MGHYNKCYEYDELVTKPSTPQAVEKLLSEIKALKTQVYCLEQDLAACRLALAGESPCGPWPEGDDE